MSDLRQKKSEKIKMMLNEGYHLKCVSKFQGNREISRVFQTFLCQQCLWAPLPFLNSDILDTSQQLESDQDTTDEPDHRLP